MGLGTKPGALCGILLWADLGVTDVLEKPGMVLSLGMALVTGEWLQTVREQGQVRF